MHHPERLPSLNALRAFETAGRHLSFTKAAEELSVTPAAVGHQIKVLEEYLGAPLFVRHNRAVALTEAGQSLLPAMSDAFARLSDAVAGFQRRSATRPLTISVEPAFGARWLLRRLDRFRERHPGVDVRIDATRRVVDFTRERVDLAIRYGAGDYPGLRVDCLLAEEVFPVCSPALLQGRRPLSSPSDLRHHTLLRSEWNPRYPTWPDWDMWLKAAGLDHIARPSSAEFTGDSQSLVLQAAIEGQGVALASSVLVADDVAAGRLTRPFDVTFPVSFCYYVVSPQALADDPKVRAFREWLLNEVSATCAGE